MACFLAYLFSTHLVPETANVSLEEIDVVFSSAAGREDAVLKRQVGFTLIVAYHFWFGLKVFFFSSLFVPLDLQIERDLGMEALISELSGEVQ